MKTLLVAILLPVMLLAGCSTGQPRETGVGAKIRESEGKQPETYPELVKGTIRELAAMRKKAKADPGGAAMEFVGYSMGIETRLEGDKSKIARQIVNIMRTSGKKMAPDKAVPVIDETVSQLKKLET